MVKVMTVNKDNFYIFWAYYLSHAEFYSRLFNIPAGQPIPSEIVDLYIRYRIACGSKPKSFFKDLENKKLYSLDNNPVKDIKNGKIKKREKLFKSTSD